MSRSRLLMPILVIAAAFALAACGSTSEGTTGSDSNGDAGGVTVTTAAPKTGTPVSVEEARTPTAATS